MTDSDNTNKNHTQHEEQLTESGCQWRDREEIRAVLDEILKHPNTPRSLHNELVNSCYEDFDV